ncbi:MAG: flagellar basal body L-ring protein FlgH [Pseudomonadota bacterium]
MQRGLLSLAVLGVFLSQSTAEVQADSLIDPDAYRALVADKRAFRIGDTITIIIAEQTTAESSANTGRDKGVGFAATGSDNTRENDIRFAVDSSVDGAAITRRVGRVRGQITATVRSLNELGHLVVEGQQKLIINGEAQSITVVGTLRPEDVDNSNAVLSSRLTNSQIEFTGKGIVSEAQKPGIIGRVLQFFGLN